MDKSSGGEGSEEQVGRTWMGENQAPAWAEALKKRGQVIGRGIADNGIKLANRVTSGKDQFHFLRQCAGGVSVQRQHTGPARAGREMFGEHAGDE